MSEAGLIKALNRATRAVNLGDDGEPVRLLSRGGVTVAEVNLADSGLANGFDLKAVQGYAMRFMRHGSNPGARLELSFGGNMATKFWAPGQVIRGGFDNAQLKRAAGSARIGKATFAILNEPDTDLAEDLIIGALGPVDLLGTTTVDGDPATWVTVAENTDPNAAYASQAGAFDGSGWELLRVFVKGTDVTTADVHFFFNPSWTGTTWMHASIDGVFQLPDSPTSGFDYRVFTVPWSGRGIGCPAVYSLLPGGLTGLDFIIQGIR